MILTASFYDMNQKIQTIKVISKISVDLNFLCLQLMHDYVYWHCSIDYCVKN